MTLTHLAGRIQALRKARSLSQEELAGELGVSRQAVSKWESGQSAPDLDKLLLLSNFFGVSTDSLLKEETPLKEEAPEAQEAPPPSFSGIAASPAASFSRPQTMALAGVALNFAGLVAAIFVWMEWQTGLAVALGLLLMAGGCLLFAWGQQQGTAAQKQAARRTFWLPSVWLLSLMPLSLCFNQLCAIVGGWYYTLPSPLPQLNNSLAAYAGFWLAWLVLCLTADWLLQKKYKKQ